MTGDFLFGSAAGFFAACIVLFVGGWLSQMIADRRHGWLADRQYDPYDDGSV